MADFVDCDLGNTSPEEESEHESDDVFAREPPAKKKRGPNVKYEFVEEVKSYDDVNQKAKNAGLKM